MSPLATGLIALLLASAADDDGVRSEPRVVVVRGGARVIARGTGPSGEIDGRHSPAPASRATLVHGLLVCRAGGDADAIESGGEDGGRCP